MTEHWYAVVDIHNEDDLISVHEKQGDAIDEADKMYRFSGRDFEVREDDEYGETVYCTRPEETPLRFIEAVNEAIEMLGEEAKALETDLPIMRKNRWLFSEQDIEENEARLRRLRDTVAALKKEG